MPKSRFFAERCCIFWETQPSVPEIVLKPRPPTVEKEQEEEVVRGEQEQEKEEEDLMKGKAVNEVVVEEEEEKEEDTCLGSGHTTKLWENGRAGSMSPSPHWEEEDGGVLSKAKAVNEEERKRMSSGMGRILGGYDRCWRF
jgi:hypothetical protein